MFPIDKLGKMFYSTLIFGKGEDNYGCDCSYEFRKNEYEYEYVYVLLSNVWFPDA